MSYKDLIQKNKLPKHIAIIMDGNGRWAQQHGHERTFGHQNGVEAVRSVIEGAGEVGIQYLTLYAFSSENWNRPQEEVDMLMALFVQVIHNELDRLIKNQVRLKIVGRIQDLPETSRLALQQAIDKTAHNTGLTVVLALSYSGRCELTDAISKMAEEARNGGLNPSEITPETVRQYLYMPELPDPDILIRTGGEYRISNFLLWQLAYTELFFSEKMWPDFREEDLWQTIIDFQSRERRFGKIGEQVREH